MASAIATNAPSTAATPTINPARKIGAFTRGLLVNSRRMAGMTLIGETVTTNARGSISPMTILTDRSLRRRAKRS